MGLAKIGEENDFYDLKKEKEFFEKLKIISGFKFNFNFTIENKVFLGFRPINRII
jgi:predicted lactoylglutathione lyase